MAAENEAKEIPMVNLTINNIAVQVPKGTKIMQAALTLGIDIPHLCYHEDQRIKAHCRLCSVEVTGKRRLLAACSTEVWEGMDVHTDTQIVRDTQVSILQSGLQGCSGHCGPHLCRAQQRHHRYNRIQQADGDDGLHPLWPVQPGLPNRCHRRKR